jgi:hypothetical protein
MVRPLSIVLPAVLALGFLAEPAAGQEQRLMVSVQKEGQPVAGVSIMAAVNSSKPRLTETAGDGSAEVPVSGPGFATGESVEVVEERCDDERNLLLARRNEAYRRANCAYTLLVLLAWGPGVLNVVQGDPPTAAFIAASTIVLAAEFVRARRLALHSVYASASAGQGMISADDACAGVDDIINSNPAYSGGCTSDKSGLAALVIVGAHLLYLQNAWLGLELGYGRLGRVEQNARIDANAYDSHVRQHGFFTPSSLFLRVHAAMWLRALQIQASAGLHRWSASSGYSQVNTVSGSETVSSGHQKDDGIDPTIALAVNYLIMRQLMANVGTDVFWMRSGDGYSNQIRERALLVRLGLTWYFLNAGSGILTPRQ